jgi:hypothetical protein
MDTVTCLTEGRRYYATLLSLLGNRNISMDTLTTPVLLRYHMFPFAVGERSETHLIGAKVSFCSSVPPIVLRMRNSENEEVRTAINSGLSRR